MLKLTVVRKPWRLTMTGSDNYPKTVSGAIRRSARSEKPKLPE